MPEKLRRSVISVEKYYYPEVTELRRSEIYQNMICRLYGAL